MPSARFEYNDRHWMYFLSLEDDLKMMARYIELAAENMKVYSIECSRLILAACAEVDVVMKQVADPSGECKVKNLGECRQIIEERYPGLSSYTASLPRYDLRFTPWASWPSNQPQWWNDYNNVKHHRDEFFARANLENVLNALAALFVALLVYLRHKGIDIIMPATVLFRPDPLLGAYCISPEGHLIDLRQQTPTST